MARDPRKNSAFDSGMRGRETPKIQGAHGGTKVNDNPGGEDKQAPGKTVGEPGGAAPAYSSGMSGGEKQKPASGAANDFGSASPGGENKNGSNTKVGQPSGHDDATQPGKASGVDDGHIRQSPVAAHKPNTSNLESAGQGMDEKQGYSADEDDTHINVRIPKASLKRKAPGVHGS